MKAVEAPANKPLFRNLIGNLPSRPYWLPNSVQLLTAAAVT